MGQALSGGRAKGPAHVPTLEVMDELGLVPYRVAGTSVAEVIGTLYAAAMSGPDIRVLIDRLTVSGEESRFNSLFHEDIFR